VSRRDPTPPPAPADRSPEVGPGVSLLTAPSTGGVEVEIGLRFAGRAGPWRLGGGPVARQGFGGALHLAGVEPRFVLAAVGVGYALDAWRATFDVRGGAAEIIGERAAFRRPVALPWWESALAVDRTWRRASIGLIGSLAPMSRAARSRAVNTASGPQEVEIPRFRVGLRVVVWLGP
jgi:hypothetical protein